MNKKIQLNYSLKLDHGEYAIKTYSENTKRSFSNNSSDIIEISFPSHHRIIPFYLDAHTENFIDLSLGKFYEVSQKIDLEGDFNDYFRLYAPLDYEIEVLTILDPDFMQMLKSELSSFDITSTGNSMLLRIDHIKPVNELSAVIGELSRRIDKSPSLKGASEVKLITSMDTEPIKVGRRLFSTDKLFYRVVFTTIPVFVVGSILVLTRFIGENLLSITELIILFSTVSLMSYIGYKTAITNDKNKSSRQ